MIKILTIVGARPQFIKAAVLHRAFKANPLFEEIVLHTGQHYDDSMSGIFFRQLGVRDPDINCNINGGSHAQMTSKMLTAIERAIVETQPTACLVYGDTNSTLAGALAAAKMAVPVIHVEAGLRSYDRMMPEEHNRVLTDHASDILFGTTPKAMANLAKEGLSDRAYLVGDIMYEAVSMFKRDYEGISRVGPIDLMAAPFTLCTVHRPANTDRREALFAILSWLEEQARDKRVVMPVHPRTRSRIAEFGFKSPAGVTMIDPVGYLEMQALLAHCKAVFTDSGGLQKEAFFHGKPSVILRDNTEWTELIDYGWARFWSQTDYRPRQPVSAFGDGNSAAAILEVLKKQLLGEGAAQ